MDGTAYSMRAGSLNVLVLLSISPPTYEALAARGAAGVLYGCVEHDDASEHSEQLFALASMIADAHPGGVLPVAERVASLRALLAFAARLVYAIETFSCIPPADGDSTDLDQDEDDTTASGGDDEDEDELTEKEPEDHPSFVELKNALSECLRAVARLLKHGPPLPRETAGALLLPLLRRAAAHFACDTERHRAMRGALVSALAAAFANAVAPADTAGAGIEAVFEGGMFDFAWRMLFRNDDFGRFDLADGQQHPSEALVEVMTRVAALPAATLARVFTPERVALAHAAPDRWARLINTALAALHAALARFAAASPALAGQLLERGVLFQTMQMLEESTESRYALQVDLAAIGARHVGRRLATTQDYTTSGTYDANGADGAGQAQGAQELWQPGAVECCVVGLSAAVFGGDVLGGNDNAELVSNMTDILRALRQLIAVGDSSVAAAFVKARGPQLLDLLRCNACTQQDGPALQELNQLLALLKIVDIASTVTISDEQRCAAVTDLHAFTKDGSVDWEAAFDAHLACSLEEGGHPRRGRNVGPDAWAADPAPERVAGAPSAAALALLQARAHERVILNAHATMDPTDATSHVALQTDLLNPVNRSRAAYLLLIAPDDARLPSHAMHFRAATARGATGWYVHRCFRPPGQPAGAALPYLTLHSKRAPCAEGPIAPVSDDIVYGEHAPVAADAEYAPGTVLVRPWSVRPAPRVGGWGASDLPTFLVYQPCAASLLPGAVPIGRVEIGRAHV